MPWLLETLMARDAIVGAVLLVLGVGAACGATTAHVLLTKREGSSVIAWTALIWMSPVAGLFAYGLLGINRVERRAARLLARAPEAPADPAVLTEVGPDAAVRFEAAIQRVVGTPLVPGNAIDVLRNGDEAYPAMLDAIAGATDTIGLLTYILDADRCGITFIEALIAARRRGVEVRVLIDGIGARRGGRGIRRLKEGGVRIETFLWSWIPWQMALINLRNHRKVLVVDGRIGFTGGMNIREAYADGSAADVHFRVRGPVVPSLTHQFAIDWAFVSDEILTGPGWFPAVEVAGACHARVIPDGPDEDLDALTRVLFHALTCARSSVLILTPYFLPPVQLKAALLAAVDRGVAVRVVLPASNEPRFMNAVTLEDCRDLIVGGVQLGFKAGVFEHTKLMLVDGEWSLLGSTNWDPRSLRLNFELNLEVHSRAFHAALSARLDEILDATTWITPAEVAARTVPQRLPGALLRLVRPYL